MGILSVFVLSTGKELEKLFENRQIQDWVSAGAIGDLQSLLTSIRSIGSNRIGPRILSQVRYYANMTSNCYVNIFWSSAGRQGLYFGPVCIEPFIVFVPYLLCI